MDEQQVLTPSLDPAGQSEASQSTAVQDTASTNVTTIIEPWNRPLVMNYKRSDLRKQYTVEELPASFLHTLPGELRNRIYRLVGVGFKNDRKSLASLQEPEVAAAITSLRPEIHSLMFAECRFEVVVYSKYTYREGLISQDLAATRGNRFGAGKLAIGPESWIRTADARAVKINSICIHLKEMDGNDICRIFLNRRTTGKRPATKIMLKDIGSQYVRRRLFKAKRAASSLVKTYNNDKNFHGFDLKHLNAIAKIFKNPDKL